MRPINGVNLVKKIAYSSRDIEFLLGDYFFGAPCIYIVIIIHKAANT